MSVHGIRCKCGGKTKVYDTRAVAGGIRRRRRCGVCQKCFTSVEVAVLIEPGKFTQVIEQTAVVSSKVRCAAQAIAALRRSK